MTSTLRRTVLFLSLVAISSCDHYHIVPINSTDLCRGHQNNTCFTLEQLTDTNLFVGLDNLTLTLSPGQHKKLDRVLSLENMNNVRITGQNNSVISFVGRSRIEISSIGKLNIENLYLSQESTSVPITFQRGLKVSTVDNALLADCHITGFDNLESNIGHF